MSQNETCAVYNLAAEVKAANNKLTVKLLDEIDGLPLLHESKQKIKRMVEDGAYGAAMDMLKAEATVLLQ